MFLPGGILPGQSFLAQMIPADPFLSRFIQKESISGDEFAAGQFLLEHCQQFGLYTERLGNPDSAFNFAASLYPLSSNKPNIVLLNHLDVVPITDEKAWKYPAFSGTVSGDTIWGRGAIDCKGLAVMQLYALQQFVRRSKTENFPYNVTMLSVSGEETGNPFGAAHLVETELKKLNPVVVFGEGGSGLRNLVPSRPELPVFGISVAEKSSLWLKLVARKKTHGHGAVPPDLYANKRLVKALIKILDQKREVKFNRTSRQMFRTLGKLEGGLKGFVIKHINWIIFWPFVKKYFRPGEIFQVLVSNTFVITDINTMNGGSANQISDEAYAVLDCRLLPGEKSKRFIRKLRITTGQKVEIRTLSESPNTPGSPITPYFEMMQEALESTYPGSVSSPILFPASTDNNFFRRKGIPTYGIIPAIFDQEALGGVHGANEYLLREQLFKGIDTYWNFIQKCMQQKAVPTN